MSNLYVNNDCFDIQKTIHDLKHYLPSQTPLKDFVHHNSLHAFQEYNFYEGIFKARDIFGFNVTLNINEFRNLYNDKRINESVLNRIVTEKKGIESLNLWLEKLVHKVYTPINKSKIGSLRQQWKAHYKIDLDNKVHPLLFRIICAYLDQGIAIADFPTIKGGFFESFCAFEKNSFSSFFKSKRVKALLNEKKTDIISLLNILVGDEKFYFQYIFDQQFAHRGWSGMVATLEDNSASLLDKKEIKLIDFIKLELLLEIDALDQNLGTNWLPLLSVLPEIKQVDIFESIPLDEYDEVLMLWQDAFEWSYYDNILFALQSNTKKNNIINSAPSFQAVFCIDERECSIRRHIESSDPKAETFGAPGFFGVEFYFLAENGKFYEKLCPAPVTPKFLIKETNNNIERKHSFLYDKIAHTFLGGLLFNLTAGIYSIVELINNLLSPKMTPAISNAFSHVGTSSTLSIEHNGEFDDKNIQVGYTIAEMTERVKGQLQNMGLTQNFGKIVYLIAHGSSSANNPHHGAHDCGACSGRPGSVNARVFSFMANHPKVRTALASFGINIPENTQFIGGLHDTAADRVEFFDTSILNDINKEAHKMNIEIFENALDLNAKERSRRFASIDTKAPIKEVRKSIHKRSVSLFEPRPELGHGSNALCIIGRRDLSKNVFLDRRAFLNSYDYRIDKDGSLLKNVIAPIGPVCGGINLEYYFSRIDNLKLGAGTKLPHNVMGLIGVANSSDGDLRPGLPLQMIEVHDPVRLLVVIEQDPVVVLKVLNENEPIKNWYFNNWIHLVVISPFDNLLYRYDNGVFKEYKTIANYVEKAIDMEKIIENAEEMSHFSIENATKENLPVYHLN